MELFDIDENDYTVRLNRVWLHLIPEFSDILKRDKGSTGDKGGQRKLWARKRFAYIYFFVDFKSPIYPWDEAERRDEALRYTGLDTDDIKQDYMVLAISTYKELQRKAARSLRTLEAVHIGLTELNIYFEEIDFKAVDKMGKLLYSAKEYVNNISMLNKAYDELGAFEKRVMAELTNSGGIRGTATKGDRETTKASSTGNVDNSWVEESPAEDAGPSWLNLSTGTKFDDTL
jgi:hypothetical protein